MGPMQNFVYLIGSTETRKVAVVDAAWEIDEILRVAAQDDMEITHALVTHTHPDHVGGRFAGVEIEGMAELLSKCKAKARALSPRAVLWMPVVLLTSAPVPRLVLVCAAATPAKKSEKMNARTEKNEAVLVELRYI